MIYHIIFDIKFRIIKGNSLEIKNNIKTYNNDNKSRLSIIITFKFYVGICCQVVVGNNAKMNS